MRGLLKWGRLHLILLGFLEDLLAAVGLRTKLRFSVRLREVVDVLQLRVLLVALAPHSNSIDIIIDS